MDKKKFLKSKTWEYCKITVLILVSSVIRSVALHSFIVPTRLAPGGVGGIASILYNYNSIFVVSITTFILNIPLMIAAYFILGKKFTILSLISIFTASLVMAVLEAVNFPVFTDDLLTASLLGGVLTGISLALVFHTGGSTGGTDIMGLFLQKKFSSTNIAWLVFAFDAVITLAGGIVFRDLPIVLYSFITIFVGSKVTEVILNGFSSARAFYIITTKKDELAAEIIKKIERGVTTINATGMYTHIEKDMLVCLVRKRQIAPLKNVINKIDPDAFVFSTTANEVIGKGFTRPL